MEAGTEGLWKSAVRILGLGLFLEDVPGAVG